MKSPDSMQLELGIDGGRKPGPRNIRIEMADKWDEITELSRKIMIAKDAGRDVSQAEAELEKLKAKHLALEQELIEAAK